MSVIPLEIGYRRDQIAANLRWIRKQDERDSYTDYRSAIQYVKGFLGLKHLFNYVRNNSDKLGSNTVMDLGCGVAYGIGRLASSSFGQGLDLRAITAKRKTAIGSNFDFSRVYITSVERLDSVQDKSVAAMLSFYGALSYTADPEQAVLSIDNKLVPGGVVKAIFSNSFWNIGAGKGHKRITENLKKLGYDCHLEPDKPNRQMILLAVKLPFLKSARDLVQEDLSDYEDQTKKISSELFPDYALVFSDRLVVPST